VVPVVSVTIFSYSEIGQSGSLPGIHPISKFLPPQKFFAGRSSPFFLLEKYGCGLRIPDAYEAVHMLTPTKLEKLQNFCEKLQ